MDSLGYPETWSNGSKFFQTSLEKCHINTPGSQLLSDHLRGSPSPGSVDYKYIPTKVIWSNFERTMTM